MREFTQTFLSLLTRNSHHFSMVQAMGVETTASAASQLTNIVARGAELRAELYIIKSLGSAFCICDPQHKILVLVQDKQELARF
jgi:hypothetical protein